MESDAASQSPIKAPDSASSRSAPPICVWSASPPRTHVSRARTWDASGMR